MKIQETNIDVTPKIASEIRIIPIITSLDAPTCFIQYTLLDENGNMLKNDRFELTPEEYAGWGYDNSYLEDIVLTKLGLTRLEE